MQYSHRCTMLLPVCGLRMITQILSVRLYYYSERAVRAGATLVVYLADVLISLSDLQPPKAHTLKALDSVVSPFGKQAVISMISCWIRSAAGQVFPNSRLTA